MRTIIKEKTPIDFQIDRENGREKFNLFSENLHDFHKKYYFLL